MTKPAVMIKTFPDAVFFKQIGFCERFIGYVIDVFAVLHIKFWYSWVEISDTVKTCLVLHNIKTHENIVQENILIQMNNKICFKKKRKIS